MTLVAKASKTVLKKNLLIVLMFTVAFGWFLRDGYFGYPANNDRIVAQMKAMTDPGDGRMPAEYIPQLTSWKGWKNESEESRAKMDQTAKTGAKVGNGIEGWKTVQDVMVQRWITWGLAGVWAISIWWVIHCQRRRAIADETTVSPAPGVVLKWTDITVVDNTRWNSMGIVDITYKDSNGTERKANFDDYVLERAPLLPILDQLAEKAVNAEFIPKEELLPEEKAPEPA